MIKFKGYISKENIKIYLVTNYHCQMSAFILMYKSTPGCSLHYGNLKDQLMHERIKYNIKKINLEFRVWIFMTLHQKMTRLCLNKGTFLHMNKCKLF